MQAAQEAHPQEGRPRFCPADRGFHIAQGQIPDSDLVECDKGDGDQPIGGSRAGVEVERYFVETESFGSVEGETDQAGPGIDQKRLDFAVDFGVNLEMTVPAGLYLDFPVIIGLNKGFF